jgi:hypothetical protein
MKTYTVRFEIDLYELILYLGYTLLIGSILFSLYSIARDTQQTQLAYDYERIIEVSQNKVETLESAMDCKFVGGKEPHTWKDSCQIKKGIVIINTRKEL